jgi:hypothetical protein
MKIDVPKIVRPVDLGDYVEEMRGKLIYVWVNSPAELLDEYFSAQKSIIENDAEMEKLLNLTGQDDEEKNLTAAEISKLSQTMNSQAARMREILAELLSQGPVELRWTAEDIEELIVVKADTDPLLYPWLVDAIFKVIGEHRIRRKKA